MGGSFQASGVGHPRLTQTVPVCPLPLLLIPLPLPLLLLLVFVCKTVLRCNCSVCVCVRPFHGTRVIGVRAWGGRQVFDLPSSRPSSALPRSSFKSTRSLTTVANKLGSAVKLGALSRMLNSMDEDADGVLVLLGHVL